jgi:hypothetical protein
MVRHTASNPVRRSRGTAAALARVQLSPRRVFDGRPAASNPYNRRVAEGSPALCKAEAAWVSPAVVRP